MACLGAAAVLVVDGVFVAGWSGFFFECNFLQTVAREGAAGLSDGDVPDGYAQAVRRQSGAGCV